MIEEVQINNLRSFDAQRFRIAPLTIFVGQNSAGKSSATRLFPLLKQSFEQAASAPILWNSTYVDYGSIHEVMGRHSGRNTLLFSFKLTASGLFRVLGAPGLRGATDETASSLVYSIELAEATKGRTKSIRSRLEIDSDVIEITYDRRRRVSALTINGKSASDIAPKISVEGGQRAFVPFVSYANFPVGYMSAEATQLGHRVAEVLASEIDIPLPDRWLTTICRHQSYRPPSSFKSQFIHMLDSISGNTPIRASKLKKTTIEKIRLLFLIRDIPRVLRYVHDQIHGDISLSQYIGPIRARAERYYRIQELAIDHIDPTGENVAMYLNYLTPSQLRRFNEIFRAAFGYTVEPYASRGHVSLMIKADGSDEADNIADVGFGFSQVLPVVAQLFAATSQPDTPISRLSTQTSVRSPIVAVEQPELHLHPAYQAKLADLFASLTSTLGPVTRRFRFVIETHSESFVNRIGRLIASGKISVDDVVIYTFEKGPKEKYTRVRELTFDEDGFIKNWPVGFLSAR